MKNRVLFCLVIGGLLVAANARPASASLFNANLIPGLNSFQDNSVAIALDPTTGKPTTTLTVGTEIVGIVNIGLNNSRPSSPPPGQTITFQLDAVFAFKISAVNGAGFYSQVPAGDIGYTLVADPGKVASLLSTIGGIGASNAFALVEAPSGVNVATLAVSDAFNTLNAGTYTLDATGALTASTDFLQSALNPAFTSASAKSPVGSEAGGLTITDTSPSVQFVPFSQGLADLNGNTTTQSAYFQSGLIGPTSTQVSNGWLFADQSILNVDAVLVPEPTAIVVWSLLTVGAGCLVMRLRRQRKEA